MLELDGAFNSRITEIVALHKHNNMGAFEYCQAFIVRRNKYMFGMVESAFHWRLNRINVNIINTILNINVDF